mmetsp:Transcript_546/g.1812  ORF Transcript_546/g.1812 Transcript_546/m.1812 type:complete len:234 (-) Transcript_546:500-1201(-)|eukprot:scaffold183238_cov31-Tisochrysis_lutea.AAC.2
MQQVPAKTGRMIRRRMLVGVLTSASPAAIACAAAAIDSKGATRLPCAISGVSCCSVNPDKSTIESSFTRKLSTSSPDGSAIAMAMAICVTLLPAKVLRRHLRAPKSEPTLSTTSKVEICLPKPPLMKTSTSSLVGFAVVPILSTGSLKSITSTALASIIPGHDEGSAHSKALLSTKTPDSVRGLVQSCSTTSWDIAGSTPCLGEYMISAKIFTASVSPPRGCGKVHDKVYTPT